MNTVDDSRPFDGLKISEEWSRLSSVDGRTLCGKCNKSRKYFCYDCLIPVPEIDPIVPKIRLPVKVDIIKHSKEITGKSTAIHAAVICPEDVRIHTYPSIPSYSSEEKVVLVFPSPNALSVSDLLHQRFNLSDLPETCKIIDRVIIIDSTWNQCKGIYKDPRINKLPAVVLRKRITQFWRHQNGSPRWHLSTIEAIHQFFVEYHSTLEAIKRESSSGEDTTPLYDGEYDNLLFFFRFMYDKIHTLYDHDSLKSYKRSLD